MVKCVCTILKQNFLMTFELKNGLTSKLEWLSVYKVVKFIILINI